MLANAFFVPSFAGVHTSSNRAIDFTPDRSIGLFSTTPSQASTCDAKNTFATFESQIGHLRNLDPESIVDVFTLFLSPDVVFSSSDPSPTASSRRAL
jgi:hypothetical protein|tara:strand:- start:345 stop:635 length:291 start_codon:yes stop_codon:yes gene_type:complete